jgi:hypothetical protein
VETIKQAFEVNTGFGLFGLSARPTLFLRRAIGRAAAIMILYVI